MNPYTHIRTAYLKRRIQSTSWQEREQIDRLRVAENIIAKGGPKSFNEAMFLRSMENTDPVAIFGMQQELRHGVAMSEIELYRRYESHIRETREKDMRIQTEDQIAQKRRQHDRYLDWLAAGGKP